MPGSQQQTERQESQSGRGAARWVERLLVGVRNVFALDGRSLALFRIGIGCALLWNLADRAVHLTAAYTDQGLLPIALNWQLRETPQAWSLHALHGSAAFVGLLFAIHAVLALAVVLGWRSRVCCLFAWLLLVSLHHRNPLLVTGGDVLLGMFLFWGCLLPLDRVWAVRLTRAGRLHSRHSPSRHFSAATVGLVLQLFCIYSVSGWAKLNDLWFSGAALGNVMNYDMLVRPAGVWLREVGWPLVPLTYATLAIELLGPWLLLTTWWRYRVRCLAVLAFLAMHVGIELTMNVMIFSWVSLAGLVAMVPTPLWQSRWLRPLLRRGGPRGRAAKVRQPVVETFTRQGRTVSGSLATIGRRLVCATGIVLILAYNAQTLLVGYQPDSWLEQITSVVTWNQRWTMFGSPERSNLRHVMPARLVNGDVVDVLREGRPFPETAWQRPAEISPRTPSGWWSKLCIYLNFPANARYRRHAAQYRYRTWNAAHSELEQIELMDYLIIDVAADPERVRAGTNMLRVTQIDRYSDGPYVDGRPHGDWIYRHRNGKVSAAGRYDAGRKQGVWKTYHADGKPESEGSYDHDQQHGLWRYWDETGESFTVRYDRGRLVQPIVPED